METIELKLDESNDLTFKVVVQGAREADTSVRFVLEGRGMEYTLPGKHLGAGEINVQVPSLRKVLDEGTYKGRLEVIADDRYFVPLQVNVDLKEALKVQAAVVTEASVPTDSPVTATIVSKPARTAAPISKPALDQAAEKSQKVTEAGLRKMIVDMLSSGNLEGAS